MDQIKFIEGYKPKIYAGPTSMVTLCIPPQHDLTGLRQRMIREKQTATNIKNNTNRKSVIQALTSICEYLKRLKAIPTTGIALFAEQCI